MLATTLLVTTLLTVMLAASLILVSAEQRTTDNSLGTARALVLAQAGLQTYYSLTRAIGPSQTYDSVRIPLSGGFADVVAKLVRPAGAASGSGALALWVVRSSGVATVSAMAGQVQGNRTIAQFAQLNPGKLPARAAMVALNGIQIVAGGGGNTNPISGHDLGSIPPCISPGGAAADTNAITVPAAGYKAAAGTPQPTGGIEHGFSDSSKVYDSTHVDWASLLGGNFFPDYTIPPGPWPSIGSNSYLVGYVPLDASGKPQDVTIPSGQRRGILVVTGNVTLGAGSHWDGIILAGGNLTLAPGNLSPAPVVHGMVTTGLNLMVSGSPVADNRLSRGSVIVQWTWCYTQSSANALSALVPIKNTWADTWSTY